VADLIEQFNERVDISLRPPAHELVAAYFNPVGNFAADTFDTLGTNSPGRITIDDLLAASMLDVRVMPLAVR
jgi:hypothetical protein